MISFLTAFFGSKQKPLTRGQNIYVFKVVLFFLLTVAILYIAFSLLAFGHL